MVGKKPFVLGCERIKKHQHRQQKRKLEEVSAFDEYNKRCNKVVDSSHGHNSFDQKGFKSIEDYIKQFHSNIAVGPLFSCKCCHQTWFEKVLLFYRTPRSQHKVKDFTAHILYLSKIKSVFVILACMH